MIIRSYNDRHATTSGPSSVVVRMNQNIFLVIKGKKTPAKCLSSGKQCMITATANGKKYTAQISGNNTWAATTEL